jgi:putative glycosyltransferase (TIGR04372 family)
MSLAGPGTIKAAVRGLIGKAPRLWKLVSRCRILLQPGNAAAHLALGHALARQRRYAGAAASYRRALALQPAAREAHLALGQVLCRLAEAEGDWQQAILWYEKAITLEPENSDLHLGLAMALSGVKRYEEAARSFRQAIALRPDAAEAHVGLGVCLIHLGRRDEAPAHFRQALRVNPGTYTAHYWLGAILAFQDKPEDALASLSQAITLNPDMLTPHWSLVEALTQAGRLDEAIGACERACRRMAHRAPELVQLGTVIAQLGEFKAAEDWCERALRLEPDCLKNYARVWTNFNDCGRTEAAKRYFQRTREVQKRLAAAHRAPPGVRYLRNVWTRQIGHLAHLECYIKIGLLGWRPPQRTVLLAPAHRIANRCYLDYMRPYVEVVTDHTQIRELEPQARYLEDYCLMMSLRGDQTCLHAGVAAAVVENQWAAEGRPPLLRLSEAHLERGRQCLRALGVPPGAWFVTLHVREAGSYGLDSRSRFRNADVGTYAAAIRSIVARGGWVVRMGDPGMRPLPPMPQVVDYAHSEYRSDWMDVFLCAANLFFLGTQSGPGHVPTTFGVHTVLTNWTSIATPPWGPRNLFLPKRCWSEKEERHLTFGEIIESGLGHAQYATCFLRLRVRPEENTAEEIKEVVEEMLDQLDDTARYSEEDARLQDQFHRMAERHGVVLSSPIGRAYLRQHASWLAQEAA